MTINLLLQQISTKAKGRPSAAMKEAMAAFAACEEQRKVKWNAVAYPGIN